MAGIPNAFSFISRFSRPPWLVQFLALFNIGSSNVNGLLGTAWQAVNLVTQTGLPANTYSGSTKKKTASANGTLTVDGVLVTPGMRIWDNSAATGSQRGLFVCIQAGNAGTNGQPAAPWILQRAADADSSGEYTQNKVFSVIQGTVSANTLKKFVTSPFTLDTTTPVITDITGAAVSGGGSGDMVLADVQTVTGAKTFNTATLLLRNAGNTFSTTFTTLASAARAVVFPDGAGNVLLDALAQTVSGVKSFAASALGVLNGGGTFATFFTTNATANRTVVLPDLGGHVMLTETNDNISGVKTFQAGTALVNSAGNTQHTVLASNATATRTATLPDATGIILTSANTIQIPLATGRNGAGAVTCVGLRVGDVVYSMVGIPMGAPTDYRSFFESVITVNDQIQQTSASDLSSDPVIGFAARP